LAAQAGRPAARIRQTAAIIIIPVFNLFIAFISFQWVGVDV
jgi:hypothetical protein